MSYEVDTLSVGDESKSGDAIALRFGNFISNPSDQTIVVIDGGFSDSGKKLVELIKNTYGSDKVDLVISTHADDDHINGLPIVLENLKVGELWIHSPWNISDKALKLASEDNLSSVLGLKSELKKSLESAYQLEQLAKRKGIKIVEPFQGMNAFDNIVHVLGPNLDYYYELVSEFEENFTAPTPKSLAEILKGLVSEVWHRDSLVEPDEKAVSPRNNSSVIILAQLGKNFLFTADAGVPALKLATSYADANNFSLASRIHYQQIPHHGSKRNLGPDILDNIIGPILLPNQTTGKRAFISAAKNSNKHPSERVSNALIRRGAKVSSTCGSSHCFHSLDVPQREGWEAITFLSFQPSYQEEQD